MFEEFAEKIRAAAIIPVATPSDSERAVGAAKAMRDGGLRAIEIAFRCAGGADETKKIARCIESVARECPELLLGAGTVINAETAKMARESGAVFAVSPGFNPRTVDWCAANGFPIFPGASSATQIEAALEMGIHTVKFFPAELLGGTKMLDALGSPFPQVSFIPTGGVNASNAARYLARRDVVAVGGSWPAGKSAIESCDWEGIERAAREAMDLARAARVTGGRPF